MIDGMTAYDQFLNNYPSYATTHALDALRAADYGRLDAQGAYRTTGSGERVELLHHVEVRAAHLHAWLPASLVCEERPLALYQPSHPVQFALSHDTSTPTCP